MASAYSVFANGGYKVQPYFIQRIVDARGNVVMESIPQRPGESAQRVIDARNAFIMTSIMRDVVRGGTAARAMKLGRNDLAGKTGTTNDFIDAWFCGYNTSLVAVSWIGFDTPHTLGRNETGASAALPIWMAYMGAALQGVPEQPFSPPSGVISARIDPDTGFRVAEGQSGIPDFFYQEFPPPDSAVASAVFGGSSPAEEIRNQLF